MTDEEAFWALHTGLPRQGPGVPADVAWAAEIAGLRPDARICDAGSGPGADIETLLAAAPEGHVTAVELHADFVEEVAARRLDRVDARQGDMADITGPYDFIWAAGSIYFLGVGEALARWRGALASGGAVAFSELCWLAEKPPEEVEAFWRDAYPAMATAEGVTARVETAGWRVLGTRLLPDAAWEAYYRPLERRIAELRAAEGGHPVWDAAEAEIMLWRRHRDAFGYLLSVVEPA